MKSTTSNLLRISALLVVFSLFISCNRNKLPKNYFKVGDDVYEIHYGNIINNGEVDGGFDLDLRLYNEGENAVNFINFEIISAQAESIESSTYNNPKGALVLDFNSGSYGEMTDIGSGKIVINRSSDGYTVEIKCTDEYSNPVEGYFKGNLGKIDENNLVRQLPEYVLPDEIYNEVTSLFPVHSGVNPPDMSGEYVSAPHALIYESYGEKPDSLQFYSDRYLGFLYSNKQMNFYGKQYDSINKKYIEEIQYNVKITGDNDYFTCYYIVDGYVQGYYAQQSFIFSGKKTYEGLEDFHVAVVLLETSGNPHMFEKHSYRILKDYDGLAEENYWLSGKSAANTSSTIMNNKNPFDIWMK